MILIAFEKWSCIMENTFIMPHNFLKRKGLMSYWTLCADAYIPYIENLLKLALVPVSRKVHRLNNSPINTYIWDIKKIQIFQCTDIAAVHLRWKRVQFSKKIHIVYYHAAEDGLLLFGTKRLLRSFGSSYKKFLLKTNFCYTKNCSRRATFTAETEYHPFWTASVFSRYELQFWKKLQNWEY